MLASVLLKIGLCIALGVAVQLVAADVTFTIGEGNRVDFVDLNGQMKLYPAAEPTTFIKIKLVRLEEVNGTGTVQQAVTNFASESFTWGPPELQDIGGVNATAVAMHKMMNRATNTTFGINAVIFHTDTQTAYGTGQVHVYTRAVKFTVQVAKWPFKAPQNKLRLAAEVMHIGGNTAATGQATLLPSGETRYAFGPGAVDTQAKSINDGAMVNAETEAITTGTAHFLQWTFDSFASTLEYGSTLQLIETDAEDIGAASAEQAPAGAIAMAICMAWIAMQRAFGI